MKKRVLLFLAYFLFWFLFFAICRGLFLIYHFHLTQELSISDIFRIFLFGSRMDLSMTGYLMVLPGVVFIITHYLKGKVIARILNIYTIIVLLAASFLVIADLELYRNWGFRLDTASLVYLKNPKEVAGSANKLVSIILIIFWLIFYAGVLYLYFKYIGRKLKTLAQSNWATSLVFLFLTAFMFLPIRGSLKMAPMNTGYVYFHKSNVFANHASVNVIWNAMYSLTEYNSIKSYNYFDEPKAERLFKSFYSAEGQTQMLLNTDKPNIILLIMESLSCKIIEPLGGLKGITPRFTALSKEGVLFANFYATTDRSEKGIISALSGYPGHPTRAIVNYSKKTESLPFLNYDLQQHGYYGEFIYGYDIDYANFRSYLMNAKYDKIVSKTDFPTIERNSKWGVHDHYVMNRIFEDCNTAHEPFFMAFASQSAHEPFDVPMKRVIQGNDEDHLFLNSAYYADSSLGDFISKAKKTNWWKNTIIVIISDHGTRYPGNTQLYEALKFHIPMLWIGGAVAKHDTIIDTYCSQSDIALTILHQIGLDNKKYKFSQDIMSSATKGFAICLFPDGFCYYRKDKKLSFDNVACKPFITEGDIDQNYIDAGKAYLQVLSNDLKNR
jgi:phosphoglycerol transferase MdoB-like AlkP superfamily enzyme